jgi:dolichyl-phosphate beta-glucosyltransferase
MGKSRENIYLSVVIPAYNESENLRRGVLDSVNDFLSMQKYSWEVILVDDGSIDSTLKTLNEYAKTHKGFRVLKRPHFGKAGTVIAGVLDAKGTIILFTDMDQATPIDQVSKLILKIKDGFDIAIGSRSGRSGAPITRKVMAYGFMFLRTLILRLPYKDTQCGFKAFTREASGQIFSRMQIYKNGEEVTGSAVKAGFDLETLYIARKLRLKVAEVKVDWQDRGDRGGSGVSPLKDSWEGLRDLIQVRVNAFRGKYHIK